MATFKCDPCDFTREVPDKFIGKRVKCPKCGAFSDVVAEAEDLGLDDMVQEEVAMDRGPVLADTAGDGAKKQKSSAPQDAPDLDAAPPKPAKKPRAVSFTQGGLVRNLPVGVLNGALGFLFALCLASLVFSRTSVAGFFPHALSMALICALVVGAFSALRTGIGFAVAGPEFTVGAVLYLMVSNIADTMGGVAAPAAMYSTVVAALAVAAVVTGLLMFSAGWIGAGGWIRFIPFQAVGGVMAGVGVFILVGAFSLSTGLDPSLDALLALMDRGVQVKFLPGVALGLLLFIILKKFRSTGLMLVLVALAVGGAHGWLYWKGMALHQAQALGWFYAPFPQDRFWVVYQSGFISDINWEVIVDQAGYMTALAGLAIGALMIKITEIEIAQGRPVELDAELQTLGLANILSGSAGGMAGSMSLGRGLAARASGAAGPLSAFVAAVICGAALFYSHEIMPWIPRFVPAGVLAYVGLSLVWRWLVDTRGEFTRSEDYSLLVLIFLVTVSLGFLLGMAVGVAMAMMVLVGRYGSVSVVKHVLSGAHFRSNVDRAPLQFKVLKTKGAAIHVMKLQGFIFLGTTDGLMRAIGTRTADKSLPPLKYLILDFTRIGGLDSSVALSFTRLQQTAADQGFAIIFSNVPFELEQLLADAGCVLNDEAKGSMTVISLDYAMEWCENQILEQENALSLGRKSLSQLLEPVFPEPKFIPLLMKAVKRIEVPAGEHVFHQGDPSDSMYFVEQGMVNVQLELDGNKVLRLKKMGPGTAFGEMGLYTSAPRSASIVAADDCVLFRLSSKVLDAIQDKHPRLVSAIHRFIVTLLAERVAEANDKVRDLMS